MVKVVSEGAIARFPSTCRERVRRCAAISSNVGQLAHSFPLLLHSLAVEYGPREARRLAVEMVEAGRPLADVAAAIGLPPCLRFVPPEACWNRLTWTPLSSDFNRLIANHVPDSIAAKANWMAAVFYAAHACDEAFAVWVARQRLLSERYVVEPRILLPLALLAWHSRHDTPLRKLIFSPWTARASYKTVVTEAKHWVNRLKLLVYFADRPITDTWLDGANVGGFQFIPLTTAEDVLNERIAMRNCVDAYAEKLAFNNCRLFGVRCLGERVALLEIVPGSGNVPIINQLKGPLNAEAPREVWRAAGVWLRRQAHRRIAGANTNPNVATTPRLQALLAPYWDAMANRSYPVDAPPTVSLDQLDSALIELAVMGGISGWPFARR
jgi:hypothetical protein